MNTRIFGYINTENTVPSRHMGSKLTQKSTKSRNQQTAKLNYTISSDVSKLHDTSFAFLPYLQREHRKTNLNTTPYTAYEPLGAVAGLVGKVVDSGGSRFFALSRAYCAIRASMTTSADIASTIGTARGTTQGSWRPLASRTPSSKP